MVFSIYSFMIAVIWVSLFATLITLLRKKFFQFFSISAFICILVFCILRLFLFFELPYTHTINCRKVFPLIQSLLCSKIIKIYEIQITPSTILLFIWCTVMLKHWIKLFREYCCLKKTLNLLPTSQDPRLYNIFSQVEGRGRITKRPKIIVHESIRSPAVIGFFTPTILLPNICFTDDELLGIFTHEWAHFRHAHIFIKFLTEIILSAFWWNIFFKTLRAEISHILEMYSDKYVCSKLNKEQQRSYLHAITKVVSNLRNNESLSLITCSLIEDNCSEKIIQRFEMILHEKYDQKKRNKKALLLFPIIYLLFVVSYTIVLQPYTEPTYDYFGDMQAVNNSDYLIKSKNDTYQLYNSNGEYVAEIKYLDENLRKLKIYSEKENSNEH